jgi:WXG100 family type VII secretion target
MPKIRLTPDVLQAKANEVTQCQEEQRQIIADVANLIQDIVADWEGEAQKGFINAFEGARPTYEKFAPDLRAFATFLTNYSQTMEYLDVGGREDITSSASAGA